MNKPLKILGFTAIIIAVLFVGAIILASIFIDPNDYREEITELVKKETGRELTIKGDLSLSFFPWVGLSIGETSLSNAKGFGDKAFARFKQIKVKVKVMPLLSQTVVMDSIVLDGVNVNLAKNKQGRSNWDDLVQESTTPKKTEEDKASGKDSAAVSIGGLSIINANLSWDDEQAGVDYHVEGLNLETGALGKGKPVDLDLGFTVKDKKAGTSWKVGLSTLVNLDKDKQSLSMSALKLQLGGLKLDGSINITQLNNEPVVRMNLKSNTFVPRELAGEFGVVLPKTNDATVLGKAQLELSINASATKLDVSKLILYLDDSILKGNATVSNFAHPSIRYQIAIDDIDVDRYMPPVAKSEAKTEAKVKTGADDRIDLPVEMLRGLDVKGSFKIGKLKVTNLRSESVEMVLSAKQGLIRVFPASAKMYGGRYTGDITLDVRGNQMILSMNEKLSKIQSAPLFKDLMDMDWVEGTANLSAKLTGKGNTVSAIKKQLNGTLGFAFLDGSIKGVNIPLKIRRAYNIIKGLPAPANEPEKTDFTSMKGSAIVRNGVIDNRDLDIQTPLLRVQGAGTADLVKESMSYLVKAKVVASLSGQGGDSLAKLKGVTIPVRIKGPFKKLAYKVELGDVLKQEVKNKLKRKLKNKLKDRFKGLF
ncbi:MAG: AsmA family protein [Gammaproteobacteria bacterium]|nr:AsmA family protein [Gammaproteobacteria bacterium]